GGVECSRWSRAGVEVACQAPRLCAASSQRRPTRYNNQRQGEWAWKTEKTELRRNALGLGMAPTPRTPRAVLRTAAKRSLPRWRIALRRRSAMERRAIVVRGIVQGVGMRPFVYGLATRLSLGGFVKNQTGSVLIEVEGDGPALERFLAEL